jgi:hypothetical protein
MERCPTCTTPLDDAGKCLTCAAKAEGLALLVRQDYGSIREWMELLADAGLAPEMERVPPADEREKQLPRWNLYVPAGEVDAAREVLGADWKNLVGDDAAMQAALRGAAGIDLDAGGEITCPACGHVFVPAGPATECPDCGLGLGGPEE